MSLVTVYAYRTFCEEQGALVRAKPYATLELINLKKWEPIMVDSLQVESSKIVDGRFHPEIGAKR